MTLRIKEKISIRRSIPTIVICTSAEACRFLKFKIFSSILEMILDYLDTPQQDLIDLMPKNNWERDFKRVNKGLFFIFNGMTRGASTSLIVVLMTMKKR